MMIVVSYAYLAYSEEEWVVALKESIELSNEFEKNIERFDEELKKFQNGKSKNIKKLETIKNDLTALIIERGLILFKGFQNCPKSNYDAVKLFDRALDENKRHESSLCRNAIIPLARTYVSIGDYKKAKEAYRQIIVNYNEHTSCVKEAEFGIEDLKEIKSR